MPLCRECYNEKSKQQSITAQILHSENQSISTGLNDSGNDGRSGEVLLDMEAIN